MVDASADFLIMAADGSRLPLSVYSNKFVLQINHGLLQSGIWTAASDPIPISATESVVVFHNTRLSSTARG
jgi:hypothetical protein